MTASPAPCSVFSSGEVGELTDKIKNDINRLEDKIDKFIQKEKDAIETAFVTGDNKLKELTDKIKNLTEDIKREVCLSPEI